MAQTPKRESNAPTIVLVLVVLFVLAIAATGSGGNGGCVTIYDNRGNYEEC